VDATISFLALTAAVLAVSLLAAYFPMSVRATDKQIHLMIAFSAGVFVGILFLILLPEAVHECAEGGFDEMAAMCVILAGFLMMFAVDFIFKHYKQSECDCDECVDHHSHQVTSLSAWIGLSIHSCFDGLSLATAFLIGEDIGIVVLIALCLHKAVAVFSLSSMFLLAGNRRRSMIYLGVFCVITPLAALISYFILGEVESDIAGLAFAFSAGVFMFVTMLHMIPEAFHRKDLDIRSLALLIAGLAAVVVIAVLMGPHIH
jgi:zinc transporter ZupT